MKRKFKFLYLSAIVLILGLVFQAQAFQISVTDVYPDLNTITNVAGHSIFEDYNETVLIPYTSHDGYAIVNPNLQYFDKIIDITYNPSEPPVQHLGLAFHVKNTTPYTWSDYHFELWDATFSHRLGSFEGTPHSDIFTNVAFANGNSELHFWAPGWVPALTGLVNFSGVGIADPPDSFGIRQVATTVPVPGSLLLLGTGLAGLWGITNWRRKS